MAPFFHLFPCSRALVLVLHPLWMLVKSTLWSWLKKMERLDSASLVALIQVYLMEESM